MITYSVEQAAELICGSDTPAKVQWLVKRLRSGELAGYKPGRQWRMTEEQIAQAILRLQPSSHGTAVPLSGLTRTSRRRLLGP